MPILSRDIAVGTRRLREDLMRERGLGADEAEKLLQGFDRSPHLDAVIETRGEEIAVGVERAMAFIQQSNSRRRNAAGLHLRRRRAHPGAQRQCSASVFAWRSSRRTRWRNLKVRDGALESLVTDEVSPLLMLPIGLALREVA